MVSILDARKQALYELPSSIEEFVENEAEELRNTIDELHHIIISNINETDSNETENWD